MGAGRTIPWLWLALAMVMLPVCALMFRYEQGRRALTRAINQLPLSLKGEGGLP